MPRRQQQIPPIAHQLLMGLGRVGVRAAARAAQSVLQDIGRTADEVGQRVRRASKRIDDLPIKDEEEDDAG